MTASHYGHLEVVRLLLESGANKDLEASDARSALMLVHKEHLEIRLLLLTATARLGQKGGSRRR